MENKSEQQDQDNVCDQSYGAEDSTPEMKIAEIDTLVSEGCVCSIENYFSVLVAQSIVTIQHQVCEEKSCDKDIFLLGMLTTAQHKEEIAYTRHSASATPRDCTNLLYTVKGQKVCRSVCCAVCGAGRTPELTAATYLWWNMYSTSAC